MTGSDYCYSMPVMSIDSCPRPTFIVTRRDIWQRLKQLDYYNLTPGEYNEVYPVIHLPSIIGESQENVFQTQAEMSCKEAFSLLNDWGLIYEQELDVKLAEFEDYFLDDY